MPQKLRLLWKEKGADCEVDWRLVYDEMWNSLIIKER